MVNPYRRFGTIYGFHLQHQEVKEEFFW